MANTVKATKEELKVYFDHVDKDTSGSITAQEVQQAMAASGLQFSMATCGQIVRLHDKDKSGCINFDEFEGMHNTLMKIHDAFQQVTGASPETLKQAKMPVSKVKEGINLLGLRTVEETPLATVVTTFDASQDGMIGLAEFLGICLFLKGSEAVFKAFDSGNQGSITVNYNQFVYAAAHTVSQSGGIAVGKLSVWNL